MKKLKYQISRIVVFTIFLTILLGTTTGCSAQSVHPSLLALSKADHTLAIVDPVTLKVLARVPVGIDPHEVIASSDGKTAYVSIYGGGSLHTLNVIDLVSKKPLFNLDTRPLFGPHGLTFVKGKVWFAAEGSKAVGRYDPATGKFDWCMGTGQDRTHMIYVSQDGERVYTTNISSGTVSILENTTASDAKSKENWEQTIIPAGRDPEGFDVSPDGNELWVASSGGLIFIIDPVTKKLKTKIDLEPLGSSRLKFTPDGKMVFISSRLTGDLIIIDSKTHKEIKKMNIGKQAAGIIMNPDGSQAFVACSGSDYVAVVDPRTLEVTGHIDVGKEPDGLAWAR